MRKIAVIGLGYVGLAVLRAFARAWPGTLGFDRDARRIAALREGRDPTGALAETGGLPANLELCDDPARLAGRDLFVLAVPTPIDEACRPDLSALEQAARDVGAALRPGAIVVLESTGYPGLTEEWLGPRLEAASGLVAGRDFGLAYSPERINPGDPEHRFERVCKVIAAQDEATLDVLQKCYGGVVEAGVFRAASIRVAEAAKVLENVQRDLNVALVNELAQICDRLGLETREVLATAATKWNFLSFHPGLVGGHCVGVDPHYLAARAQQAGVQPRVILAGREVNREMTAFVVARTLAQLSLVREGAGPAGARLAVLGLAFKPDVADPRNSRVPELIAGLAAAGVEVLVHDPLVDPGLAAELYGIELLGLGALERLDGVLLAVPHRGLVEGALELARGARLLLDLGGVVERDRVPPGVRCWSP